MALAGRRWQDGRRAWERLTGDARDPAKALGDLRLVRGLLDEKEQEVVAAARTGGLAWSRIAAALGVSRQAAWERWHDLDPTED